MRYTAIVPALVLVLAVIGGGALLHRVDVARDEAGLAREDARNAYGHAVTVREEVAGILQAQRVYALELAGVRDRLDACRRRTEWLRSLFHSTYEDGRDVEQALPGFPAWPAR